MKNLFQLFQLTFLQLIDCSSVQIPEPAVSSLLVWAQRPDKLGYTERDWSPVMFGKCAINLFNVFRIQVKPNVARAVAGRFAQFAFEVSQETIVNIYQTVAMMAENAFHGGIKKI